MKHQNESIEDSQPPNCPVKRGQDHHRTRYEKERDRYNQPSQANQDEVGKRKVPRVIQMTLQKII